MDLEAAKALAYNCLSRRERTSQEIREHLLGRDVDERLVAAVLTELTEDGYLDDQRFARLFTQDKRNLSGWGTGRIRRTLLSKGIAADVVESALRDADSDGRAADGDTHAAHDADRGSDELARALTVLQRRFPTPPVTSRDRGRALGVLLRKGYGYELAVDALTEYDRQVADAIAPPFSRY